MKKLTHNKIMKKIFSILIILLGNIIYAITVKLFILPSGLASGGTTGIGLVLNHYFHIPLSGFVLTFNIFMLILGFLLLGRKFAMTTILSSFAYPIFLEAFDRIFGDFVLTDDILLNSVFAGLLIGVALGVVIRSGASTGGMDIPPLVLFKYFRIPISISLYVFDSLILLTQLSCKPVDKILYGIIFTICYTIVIDKLMLLGTTKFEVKVVSKKHDEITHAILTNIDRGVTLLHGEGGYLQDKTQVIFSIISYRELPRLEQEIYAIDPECFMTVSKVVQVHGRGFSFNKHHAKKELS